MGSQDEFTWLGNISDDIDQKLLQLMTTYEMPPLNVIAIILARLTHLAKTGNCKEDFLQLGDETPPRGGRCLTPGDTQGQAGELVTAGELDQMIFKGSFQIK